MKNKKILAGIFLLILAVLIPSGISSQAAVSKKIKLTPWLTTTTHGEVVVDITASIKNVVSIDIAEGKIKKTADKYWKNANTEKDFSYHKDTKTTEATFWARRNGTYSVRVTTKSGKKYVNYIKISNLEPTSERGEMVANITNVSKPDSKGNYTITVDYKAELTAEPEIFEGTKAGDVVSIGGRDVEILDFLTLNENYEAVSQRKYDDKVECVVVLPKNAGDFYDLSNDMNSYLVEDPTAADFGFVRIGGDIFYAYDDFEYWAFGGDYYVNLFDTVYSGVKLKVTADTFVRLAYADREKYGDIPGISGTDYCAIRRGTKELEGVYVYDDIDLHIYESYSKKKGFTDTVSEIVEIYSP
ncbi:MAG: hypothetical protein IK071_06485 [Lachnospiraceae bacterium]|nr:hypothetical protein [Lachnospiraceae bacterium]